MDPGDDEVRLARTLVRGEGEAAETLVDLTYRTVLALDPGHSVEGCRLQLEDSWPAGCSSSGSGSDLRS